ncbi:hypothetical protein ZWY2020_022275 [Hordeum vulgare]|nr:hypothetical protein ZWY2020_022275 [Hordeum vulgare]
MAASALVEHVSRGVKLVGCAGSLNGTYAQMPIETCYSLLREAVKNGRAGLYCLRLVRDLQGLQLSTTPTRSASPSAAASSRTSAAARVLELTGIAARDNKRARITPHQIQLAVRNDYELAQVLESVLISGSGVRPDIDTELLYNMVKAKRSA